MTTGVLFAITTVLCFACPHTEQALDPVAAHDLMEQHYTSAHQALIDRLTGGSTPLPGQTARRSVIPGTRHTRGENAPLDTRRPRD